MEKKIPKKIHYCWFGGNPLPELTKQCIESWRKYCPDYEIIEWNESNFDINCNVYVQEAYKSKNWAFVSDVARLYALVNYGGIYLDTDVELLKPLDDFLVYDAFSGFEAVDRIQTALMSCTKDNNFFKKLLEDYQNVSFIKEDGTCDKTTNVTRFTEACYRVGIRLDNSFQVVDGLAIFPIDYFCPKDYETKKISITNNSHAIHHFDGSWVSEEDKLFSRLTQKYKKWLPNSLASYVAKFHAIVKVNGLKKGVEELIKWIKRTK